MYSTYKKGKIMKISVIIALIVALIGLQGCGNLNNLMPSLEDFQDEAQAITNTFINHEVIIPSGSKYKISFKPMKDETQTKEQDIYSKKVLAKWEPEGNIIKIVSTTTKNSKTSDMLEYTIEVSEKAKDGNIVLLFKVKHLRTVLTPSTPHKPYQPEDLSPSIDLDSFFEQNLQVSW